MENNTLSLELKKQVRDALVASLQATEQSIQATVDVLQEGAAGQEEYSANRQGDKQEEMSTDVELHDKITGDVQDRLAALQDLDVSKQCTVVEAGALLHTNLGNFLVCAAGPAVQVEGNSYLGVSIAAPLIAGLLGKAAGDSVISHGRNCTIHAIG